MPAPPTNIGFALVGQAIPPAIYNLSNAQRGWEYWLAREQAGSMPAPPTNIGFVHVGQAIPPAMYNLNYAQRGWEHWLGSAHAGSMLNTT